MSLSWLARYLLGSEELDGSSVCDMTDEAGTRGDARMGKVGLNWLGVFSMPTWN
jgi:hypothetical protein